MRSLLSSLLLATLLVACGGGGHATRGLTRVGRHVQTHPNQPVPDGCARIGEISIGRPIRRRPQTTRQAAEVELRNRAGEIGASLIVVEPSDEPASSRRQWNAIASRCLDGVAERVRDTLHRDRILAGHPELRGRDRDVLGAMRGGYDAQLGGAIAVLALGGAAVLGGAATLLAGMMGQLNPYPRLYGGECGSCQDFTITGGAVAGAGAPVAIAGALWLLLTLDARGPIGRLMQLEERLEQPRGRF